MDFIKDFRIKNFKGIYEGKLNFGKVNVLLGLNNSGKTSILEALHLFLYKGDTNFMWYFYDHFNKDSIFHFYDYRRPIILKSGKKKVRIYDDKVELNFKRLSAISLFFRPTFLQNYADYIVFNWNWFKRYYKKVNDIEICEIPKKTALTDLSDGIKLYLTVRLLYEKYKPNIILWDDFEILQDSYILGKTIAWLDDIVNDVEIGKKTQLIVSTRDLNVAQDLSENLGAKILGIDITPEHELYVKEIKDIEKYLELGLDPRKIVSGEAYSKSSSQNLNS